MMMMMMMMTVMKGVVRKGNDCGTIL